LPPQSEIRKGNLLVTDDQPSARLPIGLCVYGVAYLAGFMGRGTPRANPHPLDAIGILELAEKLGLSAVELPFGYIHPQEDEAALKAYCDRANKMGLRIISAGLPIEVEPFRRHLALCQRLGITTVRCVLSSVLCGDRRPIGGLEGWQRHLEEKIAILKEIAPLAEEAGVRIWSISVSQSTAPMLALRSTQAILLPWQKTLWNLHAPSCPIWCMSTLKIIA
jgi:hypothetical protein